MGLPPVQTAARVSRVVAAAGRGYGWLDLQGASFARQPERSLPLAAAWDQYGNHDQPGVYAFAAVTRRDGWRLTTQDVPLQQPHRVARRAPSRRGRAPWA